MVTATNSHSLLVFSILVHIWYDIDSTMKTRTTIYILPGFLFPELFMNWIKPATASYMKSEFMNKH